MKPMQASVPSRIDLAGGTLDIWPLCHAMAEPGITVNVAVDIPARVTVEPAPEGDGRIRLVSRDQGQDVVHADLDALIAARIAGTCPLPLLSEAVRAVAPTQGFTLTTQASGPAGAGLGGSSALLAAVLGALFASLGQELAPRDIQPLAQDVETRLLGKPTGYQDYFPPLLGGCLSIEGAVGGLRVEHLPVDLKALEARLRLVYTGVPHISGDTNWGVYRAYFDGEPQTVAALRELAEISRALDACLRAGDLDAGLDLVIADGTVRRRMAPGVSTPLIESLDESTRAAGARGTTVCGAGGGGCVLVILDEGSDATRIDDLLAAGPCEPMPLRLVSEGLRISPLSPQVPR